MNYNWNFDILFQAPYASWLVTGFLWTVTLSMTAWCLALPLGVLVGIGGFSRTAFLRAIATFYVSVFRNIPLLLQLFVWFFVIPELLPNSMGLFIKRELPHAEFWTAVVGLGFYTSGRLAVLFGAGLKAVPKGQYLAATASGMTHGHTMRHILIPQCLRIILPSLTSEFLSVVKNSSLGLTIGVMEITAQSRQIESYTFHGFEAFGAATVLYLVIAGLLTALMHRMETRGFRGNLLEATSNA